MVGHTTSPSILHQMVNGGEVKEAEGSNRDISECKGEFHSKNANRPCRPPNYIGTQGLTIGRKRIKENIYNNILNANQVLDEV